MALGKCPYCGFIHESTDDRCPKGEVKLDPVVEKVRADLHRRSQLGIAKYGTVLGDNPGDHKTKLQHAYEEALDLANYLAWAIMELDSRATLDPMSQTLQNPKLLGVQLT